MVYVPEGYSHPQEFMVTLPNGEVIYVAVPPNATPGMPVQFALDGSGGLLMPGGPVIPTKPDGTKDTKRHAEQKHYHNSMLEDEARALFMKADKDKSDDLDATELVPLLMDMGFEAEECESLWDQGDVNHDGKIDFGEFLTLYNTLKARVLEKEMKNKQNEMNQKQAELEKKMAAMQKQLKLAAELQAATATAQAETNTKLAQFKDDKEEGDEDGAPAVIDFASEALKLVAEHEREKKQLQARLAADKRAQKKKLEERLARKRKHAVQKKYSVAAGTAAGATPAVAVATAVAVPVA